MHDNSKTAIGCRMANASRGQKEWPKTCKFIINFATSLSHLPPHDYNDNNHERPFTYVTHCSMGGGVCHRKFTPHVNLPVWTNRSICFQNLFISFQTSTYQLPNPKTASHPQLLLFRFGSEGCIAGGERDACVQNDKLVRCVKGRRVAE